MMAKNDFCSLEKAWDKWIDCLVGNDNNSIFQQIYRSSLELRFYQVIFESRKQVIAEFPNDTPVNYHLHTFIDRGFFISQCAYVRRIYDDHYSLYGNRGVYSLGALIKDMKNYREKLTREKFFILRKLPYDYEDIRNAESDYIRQKSTSMDSFFVIPDEFNWNRIYEAHQFFDRLSGKNEQSRTSSDIINENIFDILNKKLTDNCITVINYTDKYIAHSATIESRALDELSIGKISLNDLKSAHKTIYEVASFISDLILWEKRLPMPLIPSDFLENLDLPLIPSQKMDFFRQLDKSFEDEMNSWSSLIVQS